MSTTPRFLSRFKRTTRSLKSSIRPWPVLLDPTSLNLPSSIPDATTRITQNLTHFRSNYALIISVIVISTLIFHPVSLIAFLITLLGWLFLYFSRDEEDPLRVLGYEVSDSVVLVVFFASTVLVLVWGGVWVNAVVAGGVGVVLVVLHAVVRSMDDLVADDIETSPYVNLLSDDDSPTRGGL